MAKARTAPKTDVEVPTLEELQRLGSAAVSALDAITAAMVRLERLAGAHYEAGEGVPVIAASDAWHMHRWCDWIADEASDAVVRADRIRDSVRRLAPFFNEGEDGRPLRSERNAA